MTQIPRDTGLGRESLYKALYIKGNPEFALIVIELQRYTYGQKSTGSLFNLTDNRASYGVRASRTRQTG